MDNGPNPEDGKAASEALDDVRKMEIESTRRALPPRWFGLLIAALVGLMHVFRATDDLKDYLALLTLGMGLASIALNRIYASRGVTPKVFPSGPLGIVAGIAVAALLFALYFGGILLAQSGTAWAPYATGIISAGIILILCECDYQLHRKKISHENNI